MTDKLRTAAALLVARWDSPQWGGSAEHLRHTGEYIADLRAALAEQPAEQEPVEMSPEFTDTARAALLWVLWHHQGGSSPVGQPIRFALGMGAHDRLTDLHVAEAKRWAAQAGSTTADFHAPQPAKRVPLTREQVLAIVQSNPDTMTAIRMTEAAHGITGEQQ